MLIYNLRCSRTFRVNELIWKRQIENRLWKPLNVTMRDVFMHVSTVKFSHVKLPREGNNLSFTLTRKLVKGHICL